MTALTTPVVSTGNQDATNPAPSAGAAPASVAPQSPMQALLAQRAPGRTDLLASLAKLRAGEPAAPTGTDTTPSAPPGESVPATEPATEPTDPVEPTSPGEPAAPAEPTQEATDAADPPGMAAVRKAEQHARRQLAQERAQLQADFDSQRSIWQTKIEKANAIEAKLTGARQDPLGFLAAGGFTESDYEALGRIIYGASPEGQKDPRHKQIGQQSLERRAQQTEMEKLQARIDEVEKRERSARESAEQQANIDRYYANVTGALGDTSPHARFLVGRNPRAAHERLLAIADELYTASGPSDDLREVPDAASVLKQYEARRSAEIREILGELAALGIDPATFGKPAAPVAKKPPVATSAAATITAPLQTAPAIPTAAPNGAPVNGIPSREEVLAGLARMRQ